MEFFSLKMSIVIVDIILTILYRVWIRVKILPHSHYGQIFWGECKLENLKGCAISFFENFLLNVNSFLIKNLIILFISLVKNAFFTNFVEKHNFDIKIVNELKVRFYARCK